MLALPFFWHPTESWRTVIAIGTEISDGDHSLLARVGGSYEFEFSGWSLSPEVNVDFVDHGTAFAVTQEGMDIMDPHKLKFSQKSFCLLNNSILMGLK